MTDQPQPRVLVCAADGPALQTGNDALDLIGDAMGMDTEVVAIPVARLAPEFFDLSTRLAGEIAQKFVNYRLRLVIVGEIPGPATASSAWQAFVTEANRGGQLWFVTDLAQLAARLAPQVPELVPPVPP